MSGTAPLAVRAEIERWRALSGRRRGNFLIIQTRREVVCLPVSLDAARVTATLSDACFLPGAAPSPAWATRMVVATRQDLWRRLRGERGLLPVTLCHGDGQGAILTAILCWLDGATPTPRAGNVLATLMENAAVRRNRQWADRVGSGQRGKD